MKQILVTGANGQLGQCLRSVAKTNSNQFIFTNSQDLDLCNKRDVHHFFSTHNIDWCINCAAYTQVDKAEEEVEKARQVNILGAENLAIACSNNKVKLIHISTDFVFDGAKRVPYTETDTPNPLGVYGQTKLEGELAIAKQLDAFIIIRTSWLYSEYGNNFLKTMLRLSKQRKEINVVDDQIGCPTYAKDLAELLLNLIRIENVPFGIYNYSNTGSVSWYGFAKEIFRLSASRIKINPIDTKDYPTRAERPKYSVLDNLKIENVLNIKIPNWRISLAIALTNLENDD